MPSPEDTIARMALDDYPDFAFEPIEGDAEVGYLSDKATELPAPLRPAEAQGDVTNKEMGGGFVSANDGQQILAQAENAHFGVVTSNLSPSPATTPILELGRYAYDDRVGSADLPTAAQSGLVSPTPLGEADEVEGGQEWSLSHSGQVVGTVGAPEPRNSGVGARRLSRRQTDSGTTVDDTTTSTSSETQPASESTPAPPSPTTSNVVSEELSRLNVAAVAPLNSRQEDLEEYDTSLGDATDFDSFNFEAPDILLPRQAPTTTDDGATTSAEPSTISPAPTPASELQGLEAPVILLPRQAPTTTDSDDGATTSAAPSTVSPTPTPASELQGLDVAGITQVLNARQEQGLPDGDNDAVNQSPSVASLVASITPAPSQTSTNSDSSSRSSSGESGNGTPTHRNAISIPITAPAGAIVMTEPPENVETSFYKIFPTGPATSLITFGWNMTNVIVQPTSLTLQAACDNGYTYAVGGAMDVNAAGSDNAPAYTGNGIIPASQSQVVWDVVGYQLANTETPLPQGLCTLRINDDRGFGAVRRAGYLAPNDEVTFALYTGEAYTPLASGWRCAGCSSNSGGKVAPIMGAVGIGNIIATINGTPISRHPILINLIFPFMVFITFAYVLLSPGGRRASAHDMARRRGEELKVSCRLTVDIGTPINDVKDFGDVSRPEGIMTVCTDEKIILDSQPVFCGQEDTEDDGWESVDRGFRALKMDDGGDDLDDREEEEEIVSQLLDS